MTETAPKTITVTEAEWNTKLAIEALVNKAWGDKSKGASFRKMLKEIDPSLRIPDELAESVTAPLQDEIKQLREEAAADKKAREDEKKAAQDAKDEKEMRLSIDEACKKYNFDDEGRKKLVERMSEKRNPDAEAAGAWVAAQMPKPQTIKESGFAPAFADIKGVFGTTEGEDDASIELLHSDPRKWEGLEIGKILNETQGNA